MIKPIQAIVYVLLGKVDLHGRLIPVIKQNYPYDKTPCITLDNSGGSATLQKKITNKKVMIPPTHPQYELYKNGLVPVQVLKETRQATVNINIWCDTERERDTICKKVLKLFYNAQSDHYTCCSNYDNGLCSYLDDECEAINDDTSRSVKNQCPKPVEYGYCNIFTKYDLIRRTFNVEQPFDVDDLTAKKPVLRSIIRVTTSYYDYHIIGGGVTQNINIDEELL